MRREERVTVQGPVKEQQPDGMSHRGAVSPSLLARKGRGPGALGTGHSGQAAPVVYGRRGATTVVPEEAVSQPKMH